jgi:DNA polymerase/3'-5' exonuclease PolX
MYDNFTHQCISMIQELIRIKEDTASYYKKLDAKEHSTDINQISFKVKNYKKWLSLLSTVDEILNAIADDVSAKHLSASEITARLDATPELSSSSLKKKLLEIFTTGELPEIAEATKFLAILNGTAIPEEPKPIIGKKRSPKSAAILENTAASDISAPDSSVKKRLANVVLTDDASKIAFDLQRITGVGAAHAKKLANIGATLQGLLDEWNRLVSVNPDNGIIMHEKLLLAPKNATVAELSRINRERSKILATKFANTRFIKELTHHQLVGVKYFDQIERRIPRAEITEIEAFLKEVARRMSDDFIVTICGSYRRGKDTSGDVDVFLTHKEFKEKDDLAKFKCNILTEFVRICTAVGFLVDHLTEDGETKYMGMCKFKDDPICHRIDIRLIAYNSYAPAILYFTGSFNFNQQMRQHALTKGYTLNEYGLYKCSRDPDTRKIVKGDLIPAHTEEDIFKIIDYPYKTPQERDI